MTQKLQQASLSSHSAFWIQPKKFWQIAAYLVIALAFYLRLAYLCRFDFHIDEYFTLAAAKFIAEQGVPLYPTGLFYDPGLPYSYFSGGLFWLFGFDEALGRWPALLFSVLAVALVIWLGKTILNALPAGVLGALLLSLSLESLQWGGRARATSMAQCFILLAIGCLWLGLSRPSARHRLGMVLSYTLALLAHFSTVVLMPAFLLAGGALYYFKRIPLDKLLWRDIILLFLAFGGAMASGVIFQPPPSVDFQESGAGLGGKFVALLDKFLALPPNLADVGPKYYWYFAEWPHGPIFVLTMGLLIWGLWHFWRKPSKPSEAGLFYLGLIFLSVLFVLIFLIDDHWQRTRYLVMQLQGVFLLLGAYALLRFEGLLRSRLARLGSARWLLGPGLALAIILPFGPPIQTAMDSGYLGWGRYDLAAEFVQENLENGEYLGTMHPPVLQSYLGQNDYYLVQSSPKLILKNDGTVGDRYSGAAWLKDRQDLIQVLADPAPLWLVIEEGWLFSNYDGPLQQSILWRMDKLWGEGGVWALKSKAGTWPLAQEITLPLAAEFEGGTLLKGLDIQPATLEPGGLVYITLFWHGNQIPTQQKVFVQLRNEANETIAQADHFIYDGKVPSSRWEALLNNDQVIREGATLHLPPDLAPGNYRLFIGFYDPTSFARLGVINDQSGERAVIGHHWLLE